MGHFFFGNEQGNAVTVNGDRNCAMLNEFLFTKIEEEDIGSNWFQQDTLLMLCELIFVIKGGIYSLKSTSYNRETCKETFPENFFYSFCH